MAKRILPAQWGEELETLMVWTTFWNGCEKRSGDLTEYALCEAGNEDFFLIIQADICG
jgi:hypothetical protein